jgi:hypothetical protein
MPTMDQDRDIVSDLHDKMGMKRRVRRREGTESKRVANAIHAIKGARTNDGPDRESPTASPTVTNSASGSPRRYKIEDESWDENDEGNIYDNEAMYAPIEEDAVYEDVYIEEIDESGYGDEEPSDTEYETVEELDEEVLEEEEEEVLEDEDEKEVSETEVNDETEFEFDEQEEMGLGSISIDETETEAGEKAGRWAVEEVLEEDYAEEVLEEEGESADGWNIEEVLEEDTIDEIENEIEEEVIEESPVVETPADVGAKAPVDTAVDDLNESCDRADVLEAITYILKQEKAIRLEILTQDQVQDIMNLPLTELLEVLEHFEVSDNSSSPIRWDLVIEKIEAKQDTEDFDAYQGSDEKDEIKVGEDEEYVVEDEDEVEIVEDEDEVEIVEDDDEVEIFEDDDEVEIFEDEGEVEIFEDEDEVEIVDEEDEVEIVEEEDEVEIVEAKGESDNGESKDLSDIGDESSDSIYDHLNSDVTGNDVVAGQGYSLEPVSAGYMSSFNNLTEGSEGDGANIEEAVFFIDEPKLRELILAGDRGQGDGTNGDPVLEQSKRRSSREPGEVRGEGNETKQIHKKGSRGKPRNDFFI